MSKASRGPGSLKRKEPKSKGGHTSKAGGVPKKETALSVLQEIRDQLKLLIGVLVDTGMVEAQLHTGKEGPDPVCTQAWLPGNGLFDRSVR